MMAGTCFKFMILALGILCSERANAGYQHVNPQNKVIKGSILSNLENVESSQQNSSQAWSYHPRARRSCSLEQGKSLETREHKFSPCPGGMVVRWVDNKNSDAMLVQCTVAEEEKYVQNNLYTNLGNSDPGDFTAVVSSGGDCSYQISLVSFATFSELPHSENTHWAFATPTQAVVDQLHQSFMWVSSDSGKTFQCHSLDFGNSETTFTDIKAHPKSHSEFLASTPAITSDDDYSLFGEDKFDLYHCNLPSIQSTVSCKKIMSNVHFYEWSNAEGVNSVFIVAEDGFYVLEQPGSKPKHVVDKASFFEQSPDGKVLYVVSKENYYSSLKVSTDNGQTFVDAKLPIKGRHSDIALVDTSPVGMISVVTKVTQIRGDSAFKITNSDGAWYNFTGYRSAFSDVPDSEFVHKPHHLFYDANNKEGCSWPGIDDNQMREKVVVVHRGTCKFVEKVMAAQQKDALAVIVINTEDTYKLIMAASSDVLELPEIPVFIIKQSDGEKLIQSYANRQSGGSLTVEVEERDLQEVTIYEQTNLYTSDETYARFSLSLPNVVYSPSNYWSFTNEFVDVFKVESTPGTYLANVNVNKTEPVTVVTNNFGATWRTLKSLKDGNERLHISLQGMNVKFHMPLPQSVPTAPGIVIANAWGDGAPSDSEVYTLSRTYISRDAGYSWNKIDVAPKDQQKLSCFEFFHDYRILDHGSAIVVIPRKSCNYIAFSLDEGVGSLIPFKVQDKSLVYDAIITEPGSSTTKAYLYKHGGDAGSMVDDQWVGFLLDFKDILSRNCGSSDYNNEDFRPVPDSECVLGSRRKIKHKKPCNMCKNTEDYQHEFTKGKVCQCTAADYRCAFGFKRRNPINNATSDCIRDFMAPCEKTKNVIIYERLPGDECANGKIWEKPVDLDCLHAAAPRQEDIGSIFGYMFLSIVIVSLLFTLVLVVSKRAREKLLDVLGTEKGCLGKIGEWLLNFKCFKDIYHASLYNGLSISADKTTNMMADEMSSDDEDDQNVDDILFGLDEKDIKGADEDDEILGGGSALIDRVVNQTSES
eukprot:m.337165 g.337165  ORF g.337165 m.337165 type:complete len:1039 (+) comp18066_c0_seq1:97-3213(+)